MVLVGWWLDLIIFEILSNCNSTMGLWTMCSVLVSVRLYPVRRWLWILVLVLLCSETSLEMQYSLLSLCIFHRRKWVTGAIKEFFSIFECFPHVPHKWFAGNMDQEHKLPCTSGVLWFWVHPVEWWLLVADSNLVSATWPYSAVSCSPGVALLHVGPAVLPLLPRADVWCCTCRCSLQLMARSKGLKPVQPCLADENGISGVAGDPLPLRGRGRREINSTVSSSCHCGMLSSERHPSFLARSACCWAKVKALLPHIASSVHANLLLKKLKRLVVSFFFPLVCVGVPCCSQYP